MEPVWVWGLPLAPLTRVQTVDAVTALVEADRPSFFITANTNYAMLTRENPRLRDVNAQAAFLVTDGAPLVWASKLKGTPLPERVAGSDLIFDLCERSAQRGFRLFFLGGAAGIADEAARRLSLRYPGLCVAGTESPLPHKLSHEEHERLLARIRSARPDIVFVAFGQPKGELWIAEHRHALGAPVCVQVGASLDFIAGQVRRAPRRLRKIGLEWAYRMWLEPARLAPRYARNARFILGVMAHDPARRAIGRRLGRPIPSGGTLGYQGEGSET